MGESSSDEMAQQSLDAHQAFLRDNQQMDKQALSFRFGASLDEKLETLLSMVFGMDRKLTRIVEIVNAKAEASTPCEEASTDSR